MNKSFRRLSFGCLLFGLIGGVQLASPQLNPASAPDNELSAARGLVGTFLTPDDLRNSLNLTLHTCLNINEPHIGFVLPNYL